MSWYIWLSIVALLIAGALLQNSLLVNAALWILGGIAVLASLMIIIIGILFWRAKRSRK